ncbi:hypothetical protein [Solibaculum mannosilyticum]|uniref:hypothetical protein n=1 Tax=Solibaculum mannosilyticum TaxID=2780922 RepID=UPI0034B99CDF
MKTTKRSLLASGLAVLVCIAMLAGTTFAWFTDSIVNKGNKIQSGSLSIDAYAYDLDKDGTGGFTIEGVNGGKPFTFEEEGQNLKEDSSPILNETLWEPGKSSAKLLKVQNNGTLAAKIKLDFTVIDGGLQDALWFDFVQVKDGQVTGQFTKRPMSELATIAQNLELPVLKDESLQFILVYGMNEEAGNEYQDKSFSADIILNATQYTEEEDGFGNNQYDKDATYNTIINGQVVDLKKDDETGIYINEADPTDTTKYIADEESLFAFAKMATASTTTYAASSEPETYVMAADVDLSGQAWESLVLPSGKKLVFDGNNHTISNLNSAVTSDNKINYAGAGFIGCTTGGEVTVKNVTFDGASVSVSDGGDNNQTYAGVIVGHNNDAKLTLQNISVKNSKVVCHWQTGGIVGYSSSDLVMTACRVEDSFVGGSKATAGTLFGLGIVNFSATDCVSRNVRLYTDNTNEFGNSIWDRKAVDNGQYQYGSIYEYANKGKIFTGVNNIVENVTIVNQET